MSDISSAFWARVDKRGSEDCWPWTGARRSDGYGQFAFDKHRWIASRFSWELANSRQLGALRACHRCDNPICVNPAHIFAGTDGDNARDRSAKARGKGQGSEACSRGHLWSSATTYVRPNGARQCRKCNALAAERLRTRRIGGEA